MRSAEGLVVLKRFLLIFSDLILDSKADPGNPTLVRMDPVPRTRSNSSSYKTRKRAICVSTPLSNAIYRKGCLLSGRSIEE